MIHHRNIASIAEGPRSQMRKYLQGAGDTLFLTEWDNAAMGDKFSDNDNTSNTGNSRR